MSNIVVREEDAAVDLTIGEAEEGAVSEWDPREQRWQRSLQARAGTTRGLWVIPFCDITYDITFITLMIDRED